MWFSSSELYIFTYTQVPSAAWKRHSQHWVQYLWAVKGIFFLLRRTALHTAAAEQISASPQWVTTALPVTAAGPSLLTRAILVTGRNPRDYRTNAQLLSGVMGSAHTATSRAELLLWSELSKVQQEGGSLSLPGHAPNDRVILCLPKMPFCLQTHSICHTTWQNNSVKKPNDKWLMLKEACASFQQWLHRHQLNKEKICSEAPPSGISQRAVVSGW